MLVFARGHSSSLQTVLTQASKCYWLYLWALGMQISFQKAAVSTVCCFLMAYGGSACSSEVFGMSLSSLQRLASSPWQKGPVAQVPPTLLSSSVQLSPPRSAVDSPGHAGFIFDDCFHSELQALALCRLLSNLRALNFGSLHRSLQLLALSPCYGAVLAEKAKPSSV